MKCLRGALLVPFLSFILISCALTRPADATSDETAVQISDILNQVQRALINVQNSAEQHRLPKLESVELLLSTQLQANAEGGFNIVVVSVEGGGSETSAQKLHLTLTPPRPGAGMPVAAVDLSESLAEAILAAARGISEAADAEPKLELEKLVASVKFVVSVKGGGGVKFEILPVEVSLGGKITSVETQEIIVTFKG